MTNSFNNVKFSFLINLPTPPYIYILSGTFPLTFIASNYIYFDTNRTGKILLKVAYILALLNLN